MSKVARTLLVFAVLLVSSCGNKKDTNKIETSLKLRFVDEYILPDETTFANTRVGGLSGIDYANGDWYAISDNSDSPRFYKAIVSYDLKGFNTIQVTAVTHFKDENGNNFWHLTTYRNTIQLPIFKNNFFKNEEDLYEYIKGVEPQIPLISRNGQSIELPETVNKKDLNEVWEYFNKWLIENNLFSTVNEISHVPYYVDPRGYTEKIFTSKRLYRFRYRDYYR